MLRPLLRQSFAQAALNHNFKVTYTQRCAIGILEHRRRRRRR